MLEGDPGRTTMKQQVNVGVFFGVICVVVILVVVFIWRGMENPYNSANADEAHFRATEAWAKKNNVDLRKDPLMAPLYYKYHPEEKAPPDVKESPGNLSG